ncbi:MAG TPA: hypothetical protein PLZ32_08670 [Saprospiraceae bacterium]|nr:hypothetical protein [Saprospiraceae bacterium]
MREHTEIPLLNWRIVNPNSRLEISNLYKISKEFQVLYSNIKGDILVEKDNILYIVDHDNPSEDYLKIIDNFSSLQHIFEKLIQFDEFDENTKLNSLKNSKKLLTEIIKESPIYIKDALEDELDELKELISDYKFYQTDEGKRYLETEKFKKIFYANINRPKRYKHVEANREFQTDCIKIQGTLTGEFETIDEINIEINKIRNLFSLNLELGKIFTFQEYQEALKKQQ